jgi:hypothetical protein
VGPRTVLDTETTGEIILPLPGFNLDRPVQSVARHYPDCRATDGDDIPWIKVCEDSWRPLTLPYTNRV